MKLHEFDIRLGPNGDGEIKLDGKKIEGVVALEIAHQAGSGIPIVRLDFLANVVRVGGLTHVSVNVKCPLCDRPVHPGEPCPDV